MLKGEEYSGNTRVFFHDCSPFKCMSLNYVFYLNYLRVDECTNTADSDESLTPFISVSFLPLANTAI